MNGRLKINFDKGDYLTILLIALTGIIICPFNGFWRTNILVYFLLIINGCSWIILFANSLKRHQYSFESMMWLFFIVFFFFAVISQYSNDYFPWIAWSGEQKDEYIIYAEIVLLLWTIFYVIGGLFTTKILERKERHYKNRHIIKTYCLVSCILTSISVINSLYCLLKNGFLAMLSRNTSSVVYSSNSTIDNLMYQVIAAISYFSLVYALLLFKNNRKSCLFLIINSLSFLIAYFPAAVPRYFAAATYGSLLLIAFGIMRRKRVFMTLFLAGLVIVFPIMSTFRYYSISKIFSLQAMNSAKDNLTNSFLTGNYDAFTMLTIAIEYVEKNGANPFQLLSSLLFFIPRSIWTSKAVGSGTMLAASGLHWWKPTAYNVSCPLVAEFYLSFGILGIIIFGFVFGFIFRYLDDRYWTDSQEIGSLYEWKDIAYPVFLMILFLVLRGDLMSSIAVVSSFLVGFVFVYTLNSLFEKIIYKK